MYNPLENQEIIRSLKKMKIDEQIAFFTKGLHNRFSKINRVSKNISDIISGKICPTYKHKMNKVWNIEEIKRKDNAKNKRNYLFDEKQMRIGALIERSNNIQNVRLKIEGKQIHKLKKIHWAYFLVFIFIFFYFIAKEN